jgi:hypothetical protein
VRLNGIDGAGQRFAVASESELQLREVLHGEGRVRKASQHELEAKKESGQDLTERGTRRWHGGNPVTGRCHRRVHKLNHTGVLLLHMRMEDKKW